MHSDVLIVGGGVAGLTCAASLARWQIDFQLLEATDRVGGRLRTDRCEGFQLDHGLYGLRIDSPVCREGLDYDALRLRPFDHPTLIRGADRWINAPVQVSLAVPAEGIAAVTRQLADRLPAGTLHTHRSVERVAAAAVQTSDEQEHRFDQLVLATEAPAAQRLLGGSLPNVPWQAITCLQFAAASPPTDLRALLLSGDPADGPVCQLAVISNIAPDYAPAGQTLVTVNVVDDRDGPAALDDPGEREMAVRKQLSGWFGEAVGRWRLLRAYHIPYALPAAPLPAAAVLPDEGPIVCGDYCVAASIEGAMQSGLQAAETIRRRLRV